MKRTFPVLLGVFTLVLLSRLPFLETGYGLDPDSWRVALSARHIADTGQYQFSRMPGHAPHEYLASLIIDTPPGIVNLTTAFASAVAACLFFLILIHFRARDAALTAVTFALTPVVFLSSLELLDYAWSISCVLGSMYAILHGRIVLAGALLGLAIGFGITLAVMGPPLVLVLLAEAHSPRDPAAALRAVAGFSVSAVTVAALCYAPPIIVYGVDFVSIPATHRLSILQAGWFATVGVFGLPGAAMVGIGAVIAARNFVRGAPDSSSMRSRIEPLMLVAWLAVIVAYAVFYLRIRGEPSKLIPIVPFSLLIFARYVGRRCFIAILLTLIASNFLGSFLAGNMPGVPSIQDYMKQRRADFRTLELAWSELERTDQPALVITGSYYHPKMLLTTPDSGSPNVTIQSWVTADDVVKAQEQGAVIYCMPRACGWNEGRTGFNPLTLGARTLPSG